MKYCSKVTIIASEPDPKKGGSYAEGWYACRNGVSQDDNPYKEYKPGTSYDVYKMDWNSGWRDCNEELNK